jgi:hypothetical protein
MNVTPFSLSCIDKLHHAGVGRQPQIPVISRDDFPEKPC